MSHTRSNFIHDYCKTFAIVPSLASLLFLLDAFRRMYSIRTITSQIAIGKVLTHALIFLSLFFCDVLIVYTTTLMESSDISEEQTSDWRFVSISEIAVTQMSIISEVPLLLIIWSIMLVTVKHRTLLTLQQSHMTDVSSEVEQDIASSVEITSDLSKSFKASIQSS